MDYISLMNGRDKLGKGSLVFSAYEKAGEVNLLADGAIYISIGIARFCSLLF